MSAWRNATGDTEGKGNRTMTNHATIVRAFAAALEYATAERAQGEPDRAVRFAATAAAYETLRRARAPYDAHPSCNGQADATLADAIATAATIAADSIGY